MIYDGTMAPCLLAVDGADTPVDLHQRIIARTRCKVCAEGSRQHTPRVRPSGDFKINSGRIIIPSTTTHSVESQSRGGGEVEA